MMRTNNRFSVPDARNMVPISQQQQLLQSNKYASYHQDNYYGGDRAFLTDGESSDNYDMMDSDSDDLYQGNQDKDTFTPRQSVYELYQYLRECEDSRGTSMVQKYIHRDIFTSYESPPSEQEQFLKSGGQFDISEEYLLKRDGPLTDKRHFSNQNRTRRMYHKNKLFTKKSQETINLKAKLSRTNLMNAANNELKQNHSSSNNNDNVTIVEPWLNETPPDLIPSTSPDNLHHQNLDDTPPSIHESTTETTVSAGTEDESSSASGYSDNYYSPPSSTNGTPPPIQQNPATLEKLISIPKRRSRVQLDKDPEPGMPHPEEPDLDSKGETTTKKKDEDKFKNRLKTPTFNRSKKLSSSHKRSKSATGGASSSSKSSTNAPKPKLRNRLSVANLFSAGNKGNQRAAEADIGGDIVFDGKNRIPSGTTTNNNNTKILHKAASTNGLRISFPSQASRPPVPEIPQHLLSDEPDDNQNGSGSEPVQSSSSPVTANKEFDFLLDNSGSAPPKPNRLYEEGQEEATQKQPSSVEVGLPPRVPPHRTVSMMSDSSGIGFSSNNNGLSSYPHQVTMRLSSIATGGSSVAASSPRNPSFQRTPSLSADLNTPHPSGNDIYTRKCSYVRRRNSAVARSLSVGSSNYSVGSTSLPSSPTTAANTAANRLMSTTEQQRKQEEEDNNNLLMTPPPSKHFMLPGYDESNTTLKVVNGVSPKPSIENNLGFDNDTINAVDELKRSNKVVPRTKGGRLGRKIKSCYDLTDEKIKQQKKPSSSPPPMPKQPQQITDPSGYYYGLELFDSKAISTDKYGYLWSNRGDSFLAKCD